MGQNEVIRTVCEAVYTQCRNAMLACVIFRSRGRTVSAADHVCAWRSVWSRQHPRVHGQQRIAAHSNPGPRNALLRAERQLPGT